MVLTTIVALLHTATSKATQVLLGRGKPRSSTASRKQHARRPARRSAALPATSEKRAKVKASDDCVVLPGVRTLASKKSVWLLDQFGVLHDGEEGASRRMSRPIGIDAPARHVSTIVCLGWRRRFIPISVGRRDGSVDETQPLTAATIEAPYSRARRRTPQPSKPRDDSTRLAVASSSSATRAGDRPTP